MSFSSDIRKFAEKSNMRLDKVARVTKLKLFGGVIQDTRVDTGRLKGNWQTSTGAPKFTTIERFDESVDLGESVSYAEAKENVTAFGVDYMTNNLPYAAVWEEKDGMVSKNISRIERNLKEAVADA